MRTDSIKSVYRPLTVVIFAALLGATFGSRNMAESATTSNTDLKKIAEDAYVYGYPLLIMDQTEKQLTNVERSGSMAAPINQFARMEHLPDANFKAVVRPNVDTLYTSAFLDLTKEPMVLHVPDTQGRYYMMPMLDAYTNVFASPGMRTTGTKAHDFVITGPKWTGTLPAGVTQIKAPTDMVWIIGRTKIMGKDDLPKVTALIRQYTLTPLSHFGQPYTPPVNTAVNPSIKTNSKPPEVIAQMSGTEYFTKLAALLQKFPPPARDKETLARFARIGITPGKFQPTLEVSQAITGVGERAMKRITPLLTSAGRVENGWNVPTNLGAYGTNYPLRAAIALGGLGANLPQDAVYPQLHVDSTGQPLSGENSYVLHFNKGQEPPVRGFWSITMYDPQGYLVANPINRFAIGDRDPLVRNPDGSIDIYVQNTEPQGKSANWLPAPAGAFNLTLRAYWPDVRILNGSWQPPALQKIHPQMAGQAQGSGN